MIHFLPLALPRASSCTGAMHTPPLPQLSPESQSGLSRRFCGAGEALPRPVFPALLARCANGPAFSCPVPQMTRPRKVNFPFAWKRGKGTKVFKLRPFPIKPFSKCKVNVIKDVWFSTLQENSTQGIYSRRQVIRGGKQGET